MSKVQLQGNASGTGIFTIASPNSNTDRTLTLPDSSGTLLNNSTTIAKSLMPSGTVLQVVNSESSTNTSWTGTNIYLGLQAAITPTSASSRIFAIVTIQCSTSGTGRLQFYFKYNTTSGDNSGTQAGDMYVAQPNAASTNNLMCASVNAVFTAGTTSTLYVKLCSTKHDGGTGYINNIGNSVILTIMEIAP